MTLDEFVAESTKRLARFKEQWVARSRDLPAEYPLDLEPGEWDEQYHFYDDDFDVAARPSPPGSAA